MKTKILGLLAAGLLAGPMAANAVVIEQDQTTVFNFDLSSFASSNTVAFYNFTWDRVGECCTNVTSSRYGDLNGGSLIGSNLGLVVSLNALSTFSPQTLDGIFSIGLTGVGSLLLTINSVCVTALTADFLESSSCTAGTLANAVPEPGTLALLGLGLLGLGVSRRKA